MQTTIDKYNETFWIKDGDAYINGYTYDGEVFMVFVPAGRRRQGVAKRLILAAEKLMSEYGHKLSFTKPISPEGKAMLAWYKNQSLQ